MCERGSDTVVAVAPSVERLPATDILGAWLATHVSPHPPSEALAAANSAQAWEVIADVCERMGAYPALRLIPRWRTQATILTGTAPRVAIHDGIVSLGDLPLGVMHRRYRGVMPQETQIRIAYDTFIARFLRYLERTAQVLTWEENETMIAVMVPDGRSLNFEDSWRNFVDEAFSEDAMRETLVLLLNSAKLAARGFSMPVMPLVSEGEANTLAAFSYATIDQRVRHYARELSKLSNGYTKSTRAKKPKDKQKVEQQLNMYTAARSALGLVMEGMERKSGWTPRG